MIVVRNKKQGFALFFCFLKSILDIIEKLCLLLYIFMYKVV